MRNRHRDTSPSVRAASIEGFADLVRRLGGDPAALLKRAGLDTRVLVEPDLRIDADKLMRLLDIAAVETASEDFGLRLAQMHGIANLGPIGILAREEHSVGAALQTLIDYLYLHNSLTYLKVDASSATPMIAVFLQGNGPIASRQTIDLAVGAAVGVLRALRGAEWNPVGVQLSYGAPKRDATHRRLFHCPIEYDAPLNAIYVTRDDLQASLHSASPAFQRQAREWIESLAVRAQTQSTFTDDVRRLVAMLLSSGRCNADRLANFYGVNRRTLHRRLEVAGQSFTALVNDVRREIAGRRVSEGRMSLSEISHALGFDQQSSFCRWFRHEFGASASEWGTLRRRRNNHGTHP
jgi:AraC-like DNA-binding protein